MKKSLSIFISLIVLLGGYYLYKELGGANDLQFEITNQNFEIAGKAYTGSYNSHEVEELFIKARRISDSLGTVVVVVNYGDDREAAKINQFIGILLEDGYRNSPDPMYTIKSFPSMKWIKTAIKSHNIVMPKPEEVREQASEFAQTNGIRLSNTSIEIYRAERELEIYFLPA